MRATLTSNGGGGEEERGGGRGGGFPAGFPATTIAPPSSRKGRTAASPETPLAASPLNRSAVFVPSNSVSELVEQREEKGEEEEEEARLLLLRVRPTSSSSSLATSMSSIDGTLRC